MSKKRRYQPPSGSQSKNRARSSGSAQNWFSCSRGRHVVRNQVEDGAETGVAHRLEERPQLDLAAELPEMRVGSVTS